MKVLIIDFNLGNIASVKNAVESLNIPVVISQDPSELNSATHIILPGQGAFKEGMESLKAKGWIQPLTQKVKNNEALLLGICLGMQLLASDSHEGGYQEGLNLIPGSVHKLNLDDTHHRLPHVGWNCVHFTQPNSLAESIEQDSDFYFVHSYHFKTEEQFIQGKTQFSEEFASMVGYKNIWGVQFHPEKSSKAGIQMLSNFLSLSLC